tara:strand:+ start:1131 stop:1748 length:618 start_codon:yes stop_codon:yes gene_type:complete
MVIILFLGIVAITILVIKLNLKSIFLDKKKNNKKKVTFDLNKNEIKLIPPRYEKHEILPILEKPSIINDNVNFGKYRYGDKIIENSNFFNSKHQNFISIQKKFNENLENKNDELFEDMFKNQKGYWERQVIDDFVNREYSNKQVDDFNNFKKTNNLGKDISNVFDQMTGVYEKNGTFFGENKVFNDDFNVMNNMDDKLYGFDIEC